MKTGAAVQAGEALPEAKRLRLAEAAVGGVALGRDGRRRARRLFDGVAHEVAVSYLIEQGWLAPLVTKATATVIDTTGVKKLGGEFQAKALQAAADKFEITRDAVEEIVALGQDRRSWLVFATGKEHAAHICEALEAYGYRGGVITDETPSGERARLFYRASLAVVNRSFNIGRDRVLDLLAKGRQTVLPPSIHPATGEPYVWLTLDTLESFPVADLPELPDDIADRLASALAPFGVECAGGASVTIATRVNLDGSESPHRALNEKALANLEAWVPALKLYGCERHNGGFRAVAHWRASGSGRPLHKRNPNLSILPEGIRDFGLDGKGYTPLDVVMAATDADLDMAFKWLQDRVDARAAWSAWSDFEGPKKNRERSPEKRPETAAEPEAVSAEAEADEGAQAAENPAPEPTPEPEAANDDEPPAVPGLFPAELLDPPGLVGDLVRWMNAASEKPSPTLNLGAALAFLGAVMGQRFESETEARTNVYIVGVAPTAFGKSYPLKAISRVMTEGGFQAFRGPADFKSDGGIRKLLEQKKTCVACIDEMGGFLKRVLDRKAAAHDRRIRDMLLALFSAANDVYQGSEGAAERAVEIINPNLCIFGASTPEDFWSAFSSGNVSDGLLPRFLIFDAGRKRPATVDPTAEGHESASSNRSKIATVRSSGEPFSTE